jgi:hypothetical protein
VRERETGVRQEGCVSENVYERERRRMYKKVESIKIESRRRMELKR